MPARLHPLRALHLGLCVALKLASAAGQDSAYVDYGECSYGYDYALAEHEADEYFWESSLAPVQSEKVTCDCAQVPFPACCTAHRARIMRSLAMAMAGTLMMN